MCPLDTEITTVARRYPQTVLIAQNNLLPEVKRVLTGVNGLNFAANGHPGQIPQCAWVGIYDNRLLNQECNVAYIFQNYRQPIEEVWLALLLNTGLQGLRDLRLSAQNARNCCISVSPNCQQQFPDPISLQGGGYPARYNAAYIIGKKYNIGKLPNNNVLVQDLCDLVQIYQACVAHKCCQ